MGLSQAADADAVYAPDSVIGPFDGRPESAKRKRRRQHVLALEKAACAGLAHGKRA